MGNTIGGAGSVSDFGGAAAALAIGSALQAQTAAAQLSNVDALFGSLGLGANVNTTA